jgi:hypothetical protein
MTPDLEQIKQRAEAATPGPWTSFDGRSHIIHEEDGFIAICQYRPLPNANAEFIAHAREDIPALLAVIDELTAQQICGVVCECGPNGEPLACGFKPDHTGKHAWATLPTWGDANALLESLVHRPRTAECRQGSLDALAAENDAEVES